MRKYVCFIDSDQNNLPSLFQNVTWTYFSHGNVSPSNLTMLEIFSSRHILKETWQKKHKFRSESMKQPHSILCFNLNRHSRVRNPHRFSKKYSLRKTYGWTKAQKKCTGKQAYLWEANNDFLPPWRAIESAQQRARKHYFGRRKTILDKKKWFCENKGLRMSRLICSEGPND